MKEEVKNYGERLMNDLTPLGSDAGKGVAPWECAPCHTRAGGRATALPATICLRTFGKCEGREMDETLPKKIYYAKFARIMQDTTKQKPRTRAQYSSPDCEAATAAAAEIICESFDGSGFDDYTDETI